MAALEVWTAEDLYNVRNNLLGQYIQMDDIDLTGYANWTPMGNATTAFTGEYDGNNYTIVNLKITDNRPYLTNVGLFGSCGVGAVLKNIHLRTVDITAKTWYYRLNCENVGALAGYIIGCNIINCTAMGAIKVSGAEAVGGLIGHYVHPTSPWPPSTSYVINNCWASVEISNLYNYEYASHGNPDLVNYSSASFVGGLIGECNSTTTNDFEWGWEYYTTVSDCHAYGDIVWVKDERDTNRDSVIQNVGGFVGSASGGKFARCCAKGEIDAIGAGAGFAGNVYYDAVFENCYARGNVTLPSWFIYGSYGYSWYGLFGGFASYIWSGTFRNCYSTGKMPSPECYDTAGFGKAYQDTVEMVVERCYYDYETSAGLADDHAIPKSTAEMKSQPTFVDWDFAVVWFINVNYNDGYPDFKLGDVCNSVPREFSLTQYDYLASHVLTMIWCWKITRQDGTVMGFTNHDMDVVYDGVTYEASSGFAPTAIDSSGNLSVDNLDVEGYIDSAKISLEDIEAGMFDFADVEIFLLDYLTPSNARLILRRGRIGMVSTGDTDVKMEIRGMMQHLQQDFGEVYAKTCRAVLGDARCGVVMAAYTFNGAVTSVASRINFLTNLAQGDGFFSYGKLTWLTGRNEGLSVDVRSYYAKTIALLLNSPYPIQTGDTFTIAAGCARTSEMCKDRFNNMVNFRGEPHVPGEDFAYAYAIRGTSHVTTI